MSLDLGIPLNTPEFHFTDPYPVFRHLRQERPVYWCDGGGFWALTRYEDVLAVSKDPETFCSGEGMTMKGGELEDVKEVETLISLDPPKHSAQRKLVSRSFTSGAVARLESHIRDIVTVILDAVPPGEPVDFVDAVAVPLPAIVIAELLGVPAEDRERFVAWSNAAIGQVDPEYAGRALDAAAQQYEYFRAIIEARRREPRTDLLSALVAAEAESDTLDAEELLRLCFLLLAAGNETTRNLISHGTRALAERPEQRRRLVEGVAVATAVEELLRWVSPVIHMARTATRDMTMHDQTILAGDQVVMFYGSANRDEYVFGPTAEQVDVGREPNPHLALGFGEHFCLGAALVRLEARVMFEELLARFRSWRVVGEAQPLRSTMIRGIKHLPMVLENS